MTSGEFERGGMVRPWPIRRIEEVVANRIFRLTTRLSTSPVSGREHEFYVIESGDWVNVIPLTAEEEVVLVKQFRHGIREVTLEIPGGLVEAGQTPAEAAARELLEETGCSSSNWMLLGRTRPNPAIQNNWCYSYLARNVVKTAEPELDETEEIEVERVGLREIPRLIMDGRIDHTLVLSAFHFLLCRRHLGESEEKFPR